MAIDAPRRHRRPSSPRSRHARRNSTRGRRRIELSRSFTRDSVQRRRRVYGIKLIDFVSHHFEHFLQGITLGQFRLNLKPGFGSTGVPVASFLPFPLLLQRVLRNFSSGRRRRRRRRRRRGSCPGASSGTGIVRWRRNSGGGECILPPPRGGVVRCFRGGRKKRSATGRAKRRVFRRRRRRRRGRAS